MIHTNQPKEIDMTNTTATDLTALAETLIATDRYAGSWAWHAAADSDQPEQAINLCRTDDGYSIEVSDGEDTAVLTSLSVEDLAEIHRQLTITLMVARVRRDSA